MRSRNESRYSQEIVLLEGIIDGGLDGGTEQVI